MSVGSTYEQPVSARLGAMVPGFQNYPFNPTHELRGCKLPHRHSLGLRRHSRLRWRK